MTDDYDINDNCDKGDSMKKGKIQLRLLCDSESDYRLLEEWYQEEEIYSHFEQRKLSYAEIKTKYYPRTLKKAKVPVFMIEYDDTPVGIIQYQLIDKENRMLYGLTEKNSYEIDIFIGELQFHNKGIGKTSVDIIGNYLNDEKKAKVLVMCPLKNNIEAITCYQKCGFNTIKEFYTKDTVGILQQYLLMIKQ